MKKVVIIGDRCTDRFVYGECKRLCPEAPVPVFNTIDLVENPGMAANVVENFKAISREYEIVFIHQPEFILKTRYVDQKTNHMFLRVDSEQKVSKLSMTDYLRKEISDAEAVIVSDYDKGFLTSEILFNIAEHASISFLDTKKPLTDSLAKAYSFIKLNESEFERVQLTDKKLLDKIIVTLGSKGAKHKGVMYPSTEPKETIDVSGAGDTFLAAFAYWYLFGRIESAAIKYANEKAALVVSKKGVVTP